MNVEYILIDDTNPEHRELAIYRTGTINLVRLQDSTYTTYGSIDMDGHDYAAFFHYGLPEQLNTLPFISESGHGLDSWDEAFLHHSSIKAMKTIIGEQLQSINVNRHDTVLLGWQNEPVGVAYFRDIDPARFAFFLEKLQAIAGRALEEVLDLEFML